SIQQKLSFSSSVCQPNSLNFIGQILFCLTTHQSHLSNQQEISVSSLTQTFPLTNTYLISQRFATFISVTSDAYAQLWTSTPPVPSQHLWFIISSTTATLSTTTFYSHNASDSRLSKTPWLVASLPALVSNTYHRDSNLFTCLRSNAHPIQ